MEFLSNIIKSNTVKSSKKASVVKELSSKSYEFNKYEAAYSEVFVQPMQKQLEDLKIKNE